MQYTKAHVGVTKNEWADLEAKAALAAAPSPLVGCDRPYCSAILVHPGTKKAFSAGMVRTRAWAVACLVDSVQKWLRSRRGRHARCKDTSGVIGWRAASELR
jgi:hypothetical protein